MEIIVPAVTVLGMVLKRARMGTMELSVVSVNSYFSSLVNLVLVSTAIDRDTSGSLVRVRDGR